MQTQDTAEMTITTEDVVLFPIVGTDLETATFGVVAVAFVRIIDGEIVAGVEGDHVDAHHAPIVYAAGELNSAIRYASSIAGHDLDVRPEPAGHGY